MRDLEVGAILFVADEAELRDVRALDDRQHAVDHFVYPVAAHGINSLLAYLRVPA